MGAVHAPSPCSPCSGKNRPRLGREPSTLDYSLRAQFKDASRSAHPRLETRAALAGIGVRYRGCPSISLVGQLPETNLRRNLVFAFHHEGNRVMRKMQALPKRLPAVIECPHSEEIVGVRGVQLDTGRARQPIPRSIHSLSGIALAGCGQRIKYHQAIGSSAAANRCPGMAMALRASTRSRPMPNAL